MRAGALSIAEAALFGRPCVLVPYPFAADDHQTGNAREFCASGAGAWLPEGEATEEALWSTLWKLGGDRDARNARERQRFPSPGPLLPSRRSARRCG